jgi:hypothetical protein
MNDTVGFFRSTALLHGSSLLDIASASPQSYSFADGYSSSVADGRRTKSKVSSRTRVDPELSQVTVKGDLTEPAEEEWEDV